MTHIAKILGITRVGSMKCVSLITADADVLMDLHDFPSEEWVDQFKGRWIQITREPGTKPEIAILPPPLWRVEKMSTGHDKLWCEYCETMIGIRLSSDQESEEAAVKLLESLRAHMSEHHPEKAAELV